MATKRTITERRAGTHARLVEAATRVVARRGFHGATVDSIASEAGFSVGALYSNFAGKDDLFLAVFDGHVRWYAEQIEAAAAKPDPQVAFTEWMDGLMDNPEQVLVFIEFWAYAVRKPKLRRQFARRMGDIRAKLATMLEERGGEDAPIAPDTQAVLLLALWRGLAVEKIADPDAIGDAVARVVASLVPASERR